MNKAIKKVIAREGLLLLGSFFICAVVFWLLSFHNYALEADGVIFGGGILLYPILRFIIWAIKMLREK